jgi:ABC-type taurine transport system ATPase subunit
MTVEQNVGFGLKVRGLSKTEISARLNEILPLVGIEIYAGDTRRRSRAASSSEPRWRVRWPLSRACCFWMSRWRRLTGDSALSGEQCVSGL